MHEKPIRIELHGREGCAAIVFGGRLQQLLGPARALRFVAFFAQKVGTTHREYDPWGNPFGPIVDQFWTYADGDFRDEIEIVIGDLGQDRIAVIDECLIELRGIWFDMRDGESFPVFDVAHLGRELSVAAGFCRSPFPGQYTMPMLIGAGKPDFWSFLVEALNYRASVIESGHHILIQKDRYSLIQSWD